MGFLSGKRAFIVGVATDRSIAWNRVHNLADFCYFNHSIHVAKGVGCATCHGRVDHMALMWQEKTLLMEWCLQCHRNPEKHLRPKKEVFNMAWKADDQATLGEALRIENHIRTPFELTSCSTCHR